MARPVQSLVLDSEDTPEGLRLEMLTLTRTCEQDWAISVTDEGITFHVNPGHRVEVRWSEVTSVGAIRTVTSRIERLSLGRQVFHVATTRRSMLFSSSVLVASRYVVGDLAQARTQLIEAFERADQRPAP